MKRALPFLLFLLLAVACKKDDFIPLWFLIINDSGYDVTLKSRKGESDIVLLKGERKDVPTRYGLTYDIVPNTPTTKIFEFHTGISITTIFSYDYQLEYLVEGTAETADIVLFDENKEKQTIENVSLPVTYQYRTFCKCPAYISAKRVGSTGLLKVKLFKKGKYVNEAWSSTSQAAELFVDDW